MGIKFNNERIQLKGGLSVIGHNKIISENNEFAFAPAADVNIIAIPGKLSVFANYKSGFSRANLQKIQENYLYTGIYNLAPDIIKSEINAGADWMPLKGFSLRSWYSRRDYDALSVWNKNSGDLLYSTVIIDSGKVVENSINTALEWSHNNVKIIAGTSFYFWDLPTVNKSPVLKAANVLYLNTLINYRKLRVAGELKYEGGRKFLENDKDKENVLLLNAFASYPVYKKLSITCSLNNMLNQKFSYTPGFKEPGLRAALGVKYKW